MTDTEEAAPPVADRMAAARAARAAQRALAAPEAAPPVAEDPADPAPDAPLAPTTMEKAALTEDAKRAAKIAALRAAKVTSANPVAEPKVPVRVTKKGHGQVSTGEHISGLGDLTYDHGETPDLPRSIALELEDRGFVEIQ
jgi:hypothetical protein